MEDINKAIAGHDRAQSGESKIEQAKLPMSAEIREGMLPASGARGREQEYAAGHIEAGANGRLIMSGMGLERSLESGTTEEVSDIINFISTPGWNRPIGDIDPLLTAYSGATLEDMINYCFFTVYPLSSVEAIEVEVPGKLVGLSQEMRDKLSVVEAVCLERSPQESFDFLLANRPDLIAEVFKLMARQYVLKRSHANDAARFIDYLSKHEELVGYIPKEYTAFLASMYIGLIAERQATAGLKKEQVLREIEEDTKRLQLNFDANPALRKSYDTFIETLTDGK